MTLVTNRCPDGRCVTEGDICANYTCEGGNRPPCADGSCLTPCAPYMGCNQTTPVMVSVSDLQRLQFLQCVDGRCVRTFTECNCGADGMHLCNGRCTRQCDVVDLIFKCNTYSQQPRYASIFPVEFTITGGPSVFPILLSDFHTQVKFFFMKIYVVGSEHINYFHYVSYWNNIES